MTAQIKKRLELLTAKQQGEKNKGFTLIELLIVIAILGVLAVVVLVAINPQEQLARTRDAGRISSVSQLGHAVSAYYTARNATYPTQDDTWADALVTSGEISNVPDLPAYSAITNPGCGASAGDSSGWCYKTGGTPAEAVVYVALESASNRDQCDIAAGEDARAVYATGAGRGGIMCSEPAATEDGSSFIN